MKKTMFSVPKMDCPSEERLIRMALQGTEGIKDLTFDLGKRRLVVVHEGSTEMVLGKLAPLNFGAQVAESLDLEESGFQANASSIEKDAQESKVLWLLLAINAIMFFIELSTGWFAQSTGLIADSLDMFADAAVYGVSLYAVGKALSLQRRAARLSGYLQFALALGALSEVLRRFFMGSEPLATYMIAVSLLALAANVTCLLLISKHSEGGVHMKASWIFSTNDVIANAGVILAGFLVHFLGSPLPDLVIGTIIVVIVLKGAIAILKLAKPDRVNA